MILSLNPITRWGLALIGLLAVVILLRLGEAFFVPPVIALLLAALLWPGVRWLHLRVGLPWSVSALVVLTGLVLLNLAVTIGFTMSIARLLQGMPNPGDVNGQQQLYAKIREKVELVSPFPLDPNDTYWPQQAADSRVFQYAQETIQKNITNVLLSVASYGNAWIVQWVLIMFFLLFFLVEGRMLTRRVVEIVGPSKEVQATAGAVLSDMAHQVRSFLVWRTLINIILGGGVAMFYYFLGLREWATWGLLTAVLCYVPYLGPIAAGVPPVIDAFVSCPTPWYAVIVVLVYIAVTMFEGYVVVPVVMGRSMEMNATTVMLACLFWELVWGMPGLFMAMPLMAAIKSVCTHVEDLRPWANLMSLGGPIEDPPKPVTVLTPELLRETVDPLDDSTAPKTPQGKKGASSHSSPNIT